MENEESEREGSEREGTDVTRGRERYQTPEGMYGREEKRRKRLANLAEVAI